MIYFDQIDVLVNGTGIVATSITVNSQNALSPVYSLGRKGIHGQNPNGAISNNFKIEYFPEIDNEPIFSLVESLKVANEHSGVTISVAGVTGFQCFLNSYSLTASPNQLIKASADFTSFVPLSGDFKQKEGVIQYNNTNSLMNGWTTFIVATSGFDTAPTRDFGYEFSNNWNPIYVIGKRTPRQVSLLNASEKFEFTKDRFLNIQHSGEGPLVNLIDSDGRDYTIDMLNVALVGENYDTEIRFAAFGDYGQDTSGELKVAQLVDYFNPNFIVSLGDNNYFNGSISTIDANIGKYYSKYIGGYTGIYGQGARTNRFFPIIGNHDATGVQRDANGTALSSGFQNNYGPYLSYFPSLNGQRYYKFKKGPVEFFCLNSDLNEPDGYTEGSAQIKWVKFALKVSTAHFKFVVFHHPPASSEANYASTWMSGLAWGQWGADAVFNGHAHSYERIQRDTLYFINGCGGGDLRHFASVPITGSVFRHSGEYGAMIVDVNATKADFRFINEHKVVIDQYTLYKTGIFDKFCSKLQFNITGLIVTNSSILAQTDDYLKVNSTAIKYY